MISSVVHPELGTFVKKVAMKWKPPQPSECQRRNTTILAYIWHILTYSQIPVMVPHCSSLYLCSIFALRARQPLHQRNRPLRRLTMLNYGDYYGTPVFIRVLVKCLFSSVANVALIQRMELWGCDQEELHRRENLSRKGIPWFMIDPRIHVYCKCDCELNLR